MQGFYRKAEGRPEQLPWHRESPSRVCCSQTYASRRFHERIIHQPLADAVAIRIR
jgi:hypothetical protein